MLLVVFILFNTRDCDTQIWIALKLVIILICSFWGIMVLTYSLARRIVANCIWMMEVFILFSFMCSSDFNVSVISHGILYPL
jgi:hypothetical protein